MSGLYEPLEPARLVRDPSGTPYSEQYHDVYHARQGALAQAQHVFLAGSRLPERWRGRESFTVCETGFGLGRNFLALWQAWRADPQRSTRLHVLAFEAHPFSQADMARANADAPGMPQALAQQLAQAWPKALPGMHRLEFESGAVTLTLAFGRIERMASQVQASVDAFFLDGFAPRLNPQMWTAALFGQLVRIARPEATVATWCTAAPVCRDLRDAGFLVAEAPGFGGRRAMTMATLRPGLGRAATGVTRDASVLVVGAGPAGANIAHRLAASGLEVTVADPVLAQGLGAAHLGHRAVAVTPLLSQDDDIRARLVRAGVLRALQRWQPLEEHARPWRCGSFVIPKDDAQAQRQQAALAHLRLPEDWVSWCTAEQATARLGRRPTGDGLWFADGQLVRPEPLLEALLRHPGIRCLPRAVQGLSRDERGWRVSGLGSDAVSVFQHVVLANAGGVRHLLTGLTQACPRLEQGRKVGGQVSYFAQGGMPAAQAITASEGYWLPAVRGWHTAGSTYWQDARSVQVTEEGHADILAKLKTFLNVNEDSAVWQPAGGWAGWRAVVAGRLPVIGEIPDAKGLWAACAFGSRGFTWAALAGDVITAAMLKEPQLLERDLLAAVRSR